MTLKTVMVKMSSLDIDDSAESIIKQLQKLEEFHGKGTVFLSHEQNSYADYYEINIYVKRLETIGESKEREAKEFVHTCRIEQEEKAQLLRLSKKYSSSKG